MLKLKNYLYEKKEYYQKILKDLISGDKYNSNEIDHVCEILDIINDIISICEKRNKF